MLAEAFSWWLVPLFVIAFAVGWRLIGWLYDRVAGGKPKTGMVKKGPEGQEGRGIDKGS